MKALVGAFNQEKALVGAFSVIVQPVVEPIDLSVSTGKNVSILYNYNALFTSLCKFMYFLRIFRHLAGMFYHRCTAQLSPDNAENILPPRVRCQLLSTGAASGVTWHNCNAM